MNKKIMAAVIALHNMGADNSVESVLPYWTELLDDEYGEGSTDYKEIVWFLKGMGCKVYRNSKGKHLLVHEQAVKEVN